MRSNSLLSLRRCATRFLMAAGLAVTFHSTPLSADLLTFASANTTNVDNGSATTQAGFSNGSNTFQNDVVRLTSMADSGGNSYSADFGFNQSNFAQWSGASLAKMYYMTGGSPISGISYTGEYAADITSLFDTPFQINVGSDNTLQETFDSVSLWSSQQIMIVGPQGLTDAAVSVVERGANDSNFQVRLITSLDISGNPDGYSNWYTVGGSDPFGDGLRLDGSSSPDVLAYDIYESNTNLAGPWMDFHQSSSQAIGAIGITLNEFGMNVNDSFYGYEIAVLGPSQRAGLDLIPGGGVIQLNGSNGLLAVPEPAMGLVCGLVTASLMLVRRRRRCN